MKGWLKWIGFLLVIVLIILWFAGAFKRKITPSELKQEAKVVQGLVITTAEEVDEVPSYYTGQIVAQERAEISSRLMGKVKGVFVKEGQFVKAGQLLLSVDAEDISLQVSALASQEKQAQEAYNSALANYEAVKKTYERYNALLKEGAITQQEFDQIKAQFESAKAMVEQAKAGIEAVRNQKGAVASNLRYANLTAPFGGYVVQKNVDVGDLAVPGHPLLVIETGPYEFEAYLPESLLGRIKVGQNYQIYVPSLGKSYEGVVVEASPSLDPATRTFRVKLSINKGQDLRSGVYANLVVPEKVKAVLVPKSAIIRRFDFTGVWVVRPDNTLELRVVKLGAERGDMVEVLSGLKGGERIVSEGVEKACQGCRVGG